MEKADRRRTLALVSIMLGAFISLLDTTIVNVALPDITTALHATSESIEWIISGYALAFGVVLILAGRLGDRFGRKNIYIFGILLFLIMSITAGYAQTEKSLIISRVIQGLAADYSSHKSTRLLWTCITANSSEKSSGYLAR